MRTIAAASYFEIEKVGGLLSRIKWCESGTDFDFCIGCRTA
jgi:hypothetical protein